MNRIEARFEKLRSEGKKGFVVYIGAGDPNLEKTRELAVAFDREGSMLWSWGCRSAIRWRMGW
jgi:tryptophan synthase alpha chain